MAAPKGNKNAIGNNGGRPRIEISSLWDNWVNDIIDLYKEGGSDVEVRCMILDRCGFGSYTLWDRWISESDEFGEVIKMGRMLSEAWWNKNGRINLQNKDFNYTGWYMQMKNRFGWKDKQEVDNKSSDGSMTPKSTTIVFTKRDE